MDNESDNDEFDDEIANLVQIGAEEHIGEVITEVVGSKHHTKS